MPLSCNCLKSKYQFLLTPPGASHGGEGATVVDVDLSILDKEAEVFWRISGDSHLLLRDLTGFVVCGNLSALWKGGLLSENRRLASYLYNTERKINHRGIEGRITWRGLQMKETIQII